MKHFLISAAITLASVAGAWAGEISSDGLVRLPPADVIILGEVHDNAQHHLNQAAAIAALNPKAVVFEMLSPAQAAVITPELPKDQAALAASLEWEGSGWPEFALYYPVFAALGKARVYGAARPRDQVRRAFTEGAAAVFGAGADTFGLDQVSPKPQLKQRLQAQFEAHCEAMPLTMMGGMVEAQRFRDAAFAATVVRAFEEVGGPVVLITGNGHARMDWGVPAVLAVGKPDLKVLTIGHLEAPVTDVPPFDSWVITDAALRDDPCLEFK